MAASMVFTLVDVFVHECSPFLSCRMLHNDVVFIDDFGISGVGHAGQQVARTSCEGQSCTVL